MREDPVKSHLPPPPRKRAGGTTGKLVWHGKNDMNRENPQPSSKSVKDMNAVQRLNGSARKRKIQSDRSERRVSRGIFT